MLPILLYSLLAVARAAPSQANVDIVPRAPIPGGTVVPLFWDVQAFPDGPTLTLNGTIQEMHKRLLEINPNYDTDFNHTAVAARGLDFGLEKRTDFNGCQLECSLAKWGEPKIKGYDEGLEYLYDHLGVPHMGPGPGACSRVSCSYGTGMWMCNDTPTDKYLISFGSVADGAKYIWDTCGNNAYHDMVGGQVFHPTGWNVILSQQHC